MGFSKLKGDTYYTLLGGFERMPKEVAHEHFSLSRHLLELSTREPLRQVFEEFHRVDRIFSGYRGGRDTLYTFVGQRDPRVIYPLYGKTVS